MIHTQFIVYDGKRQTRLGGGLTNNNAVAFVIELGGGQSDGIGVGVVGCEA